MKKLLLPRAPHKSVPIVLLTSDEYEKWAAKQKPEVANWLNTVAFTAKPGKFCVIPDDKGKTAQVVACVSEPVSLWDLAPLSRCLPKGAYAPVRKLSAIELEALALGWLLGVYVYARYKKTEAPEAQLVVNNDKALRRAEQMAESLCMARDLINTPANELGPAELAEAIGKTAKKYGAKVVSIVGDDLLKAKLAGVHTVGRASTSEPRLLDITWGNPKHRKITLIGKGVVFDTGGLDIKPSSAMAQMKKDMAGSACALAVANLVMERKLPVRLRLLVPAVENAVGGDAYRPSDVIRMYNGMTVEVGNTDAEGRLVLADAISLAVKDAPDLLVDFSTLTGAARSAVGTKISAMFANDDKLAQALENAARETEDPVWRLPLFGDYDSMLESKVADMTSSPNSPYAGAITAALFLQRFVGKKIPWVHLDFMGWNIATQPGRPEGGEAMGVRAVFRLIEKMVQ